MTFWRPGGDDTRQSPLIKGCCFRGLVAHRQGWRQEVPFSILFLAPLFDHFLLSFWIPFWRSFWEFVASKSPLLAFLFAVPFPCRLFLTQRGPEEARGRLKLEQELFVSFLNVQKPWFVLWFLYISLFSSTCFFHVILSAT